MLQVHLVGQMFAQMGDVVPLGRAVDDEIIGRLAPVTLGTGLFVGFDPRRDIGDHQVIQNTAFVVQQQRVTHPARLQAGNEAGDQFFQRLRRILAGQHQLAHVADIEQRCLRARPLVLCNQTAAMLRRILQRHFIASERHHARTAFPVPCVQRQCLDFGLARFVFGNVGMGIAQGRNAPDEAARRQSARQPSAPSVGKPESLLPGLSKRGAFSFGGSRLTGVRFPECRWPARSIVPESFRGGCSFGVAGFPASSPARACKGIASAADDGAMRQDACVVNAVESPAASLFPGDSNHAAHERHFLGRETAAAGLKRRATADRARSR